MTDSALFIVEGSKAEPKFLRKLYGCYVGNDAEIVSYGTNVHVLIDSLFDGDELDEDLDIMNIIRELDPDSDVPNRKFTDKYLVFDMDPHDSKFNPSRLRKMMMFFDDSADNGKLFVNYPMLESYRHLKCEWDPEYNGRMFRLEDMWDYKGAVNRESYPSIKQLNKHDRKLFDMLIHMNLEKAGNITRGHPIDSKEDYFGTGATEIYDAVMQELEVRKRIPVLNTSLFIPVDYNPDLIFDIERSHRGFRLSSI